MTTSTNGTDLYLPLALPPEYAQEVLVEARLLHDIAPHLAHVATFALHRGLECDLIYRRHWFVSNVETGCMVSYATTQAEAIKKAKEKLSLQSPESVTSAYRRVIKSYGVPA